jgi:polar amino acid transport system substrate-binding protein
MINSYVFYKLQDSPVEWDGDKFSKLKNKIGIGSGYSATEALKKRGIPVDDTATGVLANLNKLSAGRVGVILDAPERTDFLIRQNPKFSNIIKLMPPFQVKPYYLRLSHKFVEEHPPLADDIWNAIGRIRDSDAMVKINEKYYY